MVVYLRAQAAISIAFALFFVFAGSVPVLFAKGKIGWSRAPWIAAGAIAAIALVYFGIRGLLVARPALVLTQDQLRVGDEVVPLDATTRIDHVDDALAFPPEDRRGRAAMPGLMDFPPRFAGGPWIAVRTGDREVRFQPLLYGPGKFVEGGQPAAAELVARLVTHGTDGDARAWLREAFPPASDPHPEPASLRTFMIPFLLVSIPVLALFGAAFVIGLKKRLFT